MTSEAKIDRKAKVKVRYSNDEDYRKKNIGKKSDFPLVCSLLDPNEKKEGIFFVCDLAYT